MTSSQREAFQGAHFLILGENAEQDTEEVHIRHVGGQNVLDGGAARDEVEALEDHADLAPEFQHIDIAVKDILPVNDDLPLDTLFAVEFEDAVVNSQMSGFSASGGPDHGGDAVLRDFQIVVEQRLVVSVKEVEVLRGDFDFRSFFVVNGHVKHFSSPCRCNGGQCSSAVMLS